MKSTFLPKLAENVVVSYLYAAVLLLTADNADYLNVGFLKGVALAAIPAALAVVKGFLAKQVGDPESPAFTE
jgi:hypothetical protein